MKTAYLELNTTNQIRSLSNSSLDSFSYKGIHIFPSMKVTSLNTILSMDFDYFILDMGVLTNYTAMELSKCHKQFLVCNFCEWKKNLHIQKIEDLLKNTNLNRRRLTLLRTFENKSTLSNLLSFDVKTFPFIPNPFQLPANLFSSLSQLLELERID